MTDYNAGGTSELIERIEDLEKELQTEPNTKNMLKIPLKKEQLNNLATELYGYAIEEFWNTIGNNIDDDIYTLLTKEQQTYFDVHDAEYDELLETMRDEVFELIAEQIKKY